MKLRLQNRNCADFAVRLVCMIVAGGAVGGCPGKPYLSYGDATSASVGYINNDITAATAVAAEHCARYERVPRFLDAQENIAHFACESR
ncbi:MAG TPA: hypothetical protein VGR45_17225 [Stellaceae bacterium]|nr:hypothetical protein [Stellaceae bacterium]